MLWTPSAPLIEVPRRRVRRAPAPVQCGMMGMGMGLSVAPGSAQWTPASLGSALQTWLRADLGITIGTGVSAWADQSGSGDTNKNVTMAAGAQQPTYNATDAAYNNKPTLSFASVNAQFLASGAWASPLALPETVFVVGNDDGTATNQYYCDGASGSNQRVMTGGLAGAGDLTIFNGTLLSGTGAASGVKQIFAAYFDTGSSSRLWSSAITPAATGSAGTTDASRTGLTVGGSGALLNGKIAEIFIVAGAMSASDFSNAMHYCGTRYAITVGA